jgi:hypothetical protein
MKRLTVSVVSLMLCSCSTLTPQDQKDVKAIKSEGRSALAKILMGGVTVLSNVITNVALNSLQLTQDRK